MGGDRHFLLRRMKFASPENVRGSEIKIEESAARILIDSLTGALAAPRLAFELTMATETKVVMRLTRSQHMAVLDVLMEHVRVPDHTEFFINCSTSPPTETTIGELLRLFGDASEFEAGGTDSIHAPSHES